MESAATQHAAGPGTQTSCCSGAGSESHRLGTGRTTSPPSGKERGFIILWEPSAKGTPQFSLESRLHHSPCCRSSQPSPALGEGLGPRGQTFNAMLLKASSTRTTRLRVPHRRALCKLRLHSGATEG